MASYQLVKYKKGKKQFEVMTKPGAVLKFRAGKLGWDNVLAADLVFTNQKKGDRAAPADLLEVFGTDKEDEVLRRIVAEGDLQVSSAERKEALDKKTHEILSFIHANYLDAKSNLPHPVARLEIALGNAKFRVDPELPAKAQALDLIKKLQGTLSFKKSAIEGTLSCEHRFSGQVGGVVYKLAEVQREKSTPTGYQWEVAVVPGDFDNFLSSLNKATDGGNFQFHSANAPQEESKEEDAGGKKGKKGKKGGGWQKKKKDDAEKGAAKKGKKGRK